MTTKIRSMRLNGMQRLVCKQKPLQTKRCTRLLASSGSCAPLADHRKFMTRHGGYFSLMYTHERIRRNTSCGWGIKEWYS